MAAHARRVESLLSPAGLWDTGLQLGDWLDPEAPPGEPFKAKADHVVATACFYRPRGPSRTPRSCWAGPMRRATSGAGRTGAGRVQPALRRRRPGRASDCATVYALAIVFGLLDAGRRAARRRPAGGAGQGERLPDLNRVRRHALRH